MLKGLRKLYLTPQKVMESEKPFIKDMGRDKDSECLAPGECIHSLEQEISRLYPRFTRAHVYKLHLCTAAFDSF